MDTKEHSLITFERTSHLSPNKAYLRDIFVLPMYLG